MKICQRTSTGVSSVGRTRIGHFDKRLGLKASPQVEKELNFPHIRCALGARRKRPFASRHQNAGVRVHVEHQHSVAEANRFSQRGLVASGGVLKGSRAGWGSAPLWFSFFARLGECTSYTLRIEVFAVNWSSGLLTPGVIQGASFDPVESEFIDKLQDDGFSRGVIARYRQRDSPRCAFGLAQVSARCC